MAPLSKPGCINGGAQLRADDGGGKALLERVQEAYQSVRHRPPGVNVEVLQAYCEWIGVKNPLDETGEDRDPLWTNYHAVEKMETVLNIRW